MVDENKIAEKNQANDLKVFEDRFRKIVGQNTTQDEIAKKINTSRQNVGNWLSGKSKPDIGALIKISLAYSVSTDFLLGLTNIKTVNADLASACEYTGLSQSAVNELCLYKKAGSNIISELLTSIQFQLVLQALEDLVKESNELDKTPIELQKSNDKDRMRQIDLKYRHCDLICFNAEKQFRKVIDMCDARTNEKPFDNETGKTKDKPKVKKGG